MITIDIKDISGQVRFSVPITENSIFVEELMKSDYIQLSWNSDTGETMPVGSYIEYNGEIYRLLEPYSPSMENEAKYIYSPKFQSRIMAWDKQITPVYTYEQDGTTVKSREMDWTFTGSPADAMYIIKQAIKNETGEIWNIELSSELPATISIQSQSSSIFSVLNTIATECYTEWRADKKTNTLYLSKCIYGDPITLEVGKNIQVPTVTNSGEGYFTRFYAFGSTRNIVQSSTEGNASVNKRLTLDPAKYPNGYKDIRQGLKQSEIFVKVLYFDDIYPSSKLAISDVRARLRYRLDNSGNKIKIGGTDEEPVYEQYAIWYFQIAGFEFNPDTIIEGPNLSASFESGQLAGRDFELIYHQENKRVSDSNDVTPFDINAGDYEIVIDETSGQIIPGVAYIIPQDGDSIVLYNIEMPSEYTSSAQTELEAALDKKMSSYEEDNNTYQMSSDPTRFYSEETDVNMGQAITFVNGSQTLSTRAMMVEKRLDLPCYQTIKIGNKIIKGNTQSLKDEVANANQSIDVINAFNELSKSLSQAYANAQREMIEGFARIGNMWKFDTENENTIYTEFNAYSKGELAAGGFSTEGGEGGGGEGGGGIDENKLWEILAKEGTQQINKSHIKTALSGYATEQWVLQKEYITSAALNGYATQEWVTNNFVTTEKLTEQLKKYVTLESFNPFKETVDAHISNNNIHLTAEEKEKLSWFAKDASGNIYVTNGLNFYTEGELSAGGYEEGEGGGGTGNIFGIKVNGQTYTPEEGYITIPDYPTELSWGAITGKPSWIGGTKPSYSFSEITGKPTTLSGYGITDAYTKTESDGRYATLSTADTRYVKKSGDMMTGALTINAPKNCILTLNSSGSGTDFYPYIELQHDGVRQGVYGASANRPYFYDNGWKKIWHEGNDGRGSGLDADTLDGVHNGNVTAATLASRGRNSAITGKPSVAGVQMFEVYVNGYPCPYGNLLRVKGASASGSGELLLGWSGANNAVEHIYYRNNRDAVTTWSEWRTLAFTTDNVASASKLQTPRTIWGQSFDGTGDVEGRLTARSGIVTSYDGGMWIEMAKKDNIIQGNRNQVAYSAHALYRVKNSNGDAIVFGGLGVNTGFYGFTADRISSGENGTDWSTTWNVGTGDIAHAKGISIGNWITVGSTAAVSGRLSANGGIYTTDINGNGSALYLGNSGNSSYVYLREDMKASSGNWSIPVSGNVTFASLRVNSTSTLTGSVTMGSTLSVSGNITCSSNISATGEIAAGSSSDRRLKSILKKQDYIKRLLSLGMVVDYEYNDLAFSRNVRLIEKRAYTGLIYQKVKDVLPQMAGEDADGYGYLNYIHTDYINLIAGALQQTILKQETIEQRVERLEKENAELKQKLIELAA